MVRFLLYIFFFALVSGTSFSQNGSDTLLFKLQYQTGVKYIFKTVAGTSHTGYVIKETKDVVTIENRNINEKLELNKRDIISGTAVKEKKPLKEEAYEENQHAESYLFSGTAFEFEEGRVVTNNHWLLLQNVEYGIGKNWAFTSNAFAFYPLSIGLKFAFKISDLNYVGGSAFAMGSLLGANTSANPFWGYGLQAKYTHGTTNNNFTLSGGLLGLNANLFVINPTNPFLNVGFLNAGYCNRFSKNVAFVAETWYVPVTQSIIGGLGFKLINDERYCWSLGCYSFMVANDNTFKLNLKSIPIPYIGIGRKFN